MSDWEEWTKRKIHEIQDTIGYGKAVVALSGGVDSAVVAMLAFKALNPSQILVFTIDDGFRRDREPKWVVDTFAKVYIPVRTVYCYEVLDASLGGQLSGLEDGDSRRTVFSHVFGQMCGKVAQKFGAKHIFLGTNALDLKETSHGGQKQHNAWALMGIDTKEEFGFEPVEPIDSLLKDDVRQLAEHLGLPLEIVHRMPFPGPGLSIRVMDAVTPENIHLVRRATAIVETWLSDIRPKPFQYLAFLMSGKATTRREQGESGHIVSVRCLDSDDSGQTATATEIAPGVRDGLINALLVLPEIARVVFDLTPKPPGRIEYM